MNIRTTLHTLLLAGALAAGNLASAQTTSTTAASTSGDTQVNERAARIALAEGVMKVNGVLYIVTAGIAHRIDLADGQMATLDGLVRPIPPNATLPGNIPQATISSRPGSPSGTAGSQNANRNDVNTTGTGATNTPQPERNRAVGDPSPGASTPSVK